MDPKSFAGGAVVGHINISDMFPDRFAEGPNEVGYQKTFFFLISGRDHLKVKELITWEANEINST